MMQTYQQEVARPDRPDGEMLAESGIRLQPRKMADNESVVSDGSIWRGTSLVRGISLAGAAAVAVPSKPHAAAVSHAVAVSHAAVSVKATYCSPRCYLFRSIW